MKRLERFELIDTIGRELQSRMTYSDIDAYLKLCGVNTHKETSNVNSKWVYVKELLADENEKIILDIADELEIDYENTPVSVDANDVSFWRPGHFRLFISHVSTYKRNVALLQQSLCKYGISAFVAHEDIVPSREWRIEIEKALFTMDGMLAVLTEGFKESQWTDQEIGIAIGLQKTIIPLIKDFDPYGFFGKYQGLQTNGKSVDQVAEEVFNNLLQDKRTKSKLLNAVVEQLLLANNEDQIIFLLSILEQQEDLSEEILNNLHTNAQKNEKLLSSGTLSRINKLLEDGGFQKLQSAADQDDIISIEDIPF